MKYITLIAVIAILIIQWSGEVPKSSVGGRTPEGVVD